MFNFTKSAEALSFYGRSSHTGGNRPRNKSQSDKEMIPFPPVLEHTDLPPASLEPSIDGPPSRQRIRAYTEQMKRGSAYSQHSRTPTSSSTNSSLRRGSASTESGDQGSLSRQSSIRSSTSGMPKAERPESIIGKVLFPRGSKKDKQDDSNLNSPSSVSVQSAASTEKTSAKEHYYGRSKSLRRPQFMNSSSTEDFKKHQISGPYNFQHVTHTRQDHLPNLSRASRDDLASEFSAISASQAPAHGQLKGIKADDLTSSLEGINTKPRSAAEMNLHISPPPRSRKLLMSNSNSARQRPKVSQVRSQESLRTPPPRPYRDPSCPLELPPRTSSRTASMIWEEYDPLMTTSLQRPKTAAAFRQPKAFHLPTSPPKPFFRTEEKHGFMPNTVVSDRNSGIDAWPLQVTPFDTPPLPDVPEEDEYFAKRRSRSSVISADLRSTKSVPNLRNARQSMIKAFPESANDRPRTPQSTVTVRGDLNAAENAEIGVAVSPVKPSINVTSESWEDDIDYCYEHELEANCDYDWDRDSVKEGSTSTQAPKPALPIDNQFLNTLVQSKIASSTQAPTQTSDSRPYNDFHPAPSLLVPPPLELPELSPMSNGSLDSPELRTPHVLVRPAHLRTNSRASSFKESHGFTLSPSLLIPKDFSTQIEHEELYEELMAHDHEHDPSLHIQGQYEPYPLSPVDGPSGSASFRSSGFSRSSNGATLSKNNSHESVVLLSRAASVVLEHRSMSSVGSLPDLIPSKRSRSDMRDLDFTPRSPINTSTDDLTSIAASSLSSSQIDELPEETTPTADFDNLTLNPLYEDFDQSDLAHRRKHSAPLQRVSEKSKGRQRSATTSQRPKSRGSYMLFPQTA